jgi:hypothetical protein
MRGISGIAKNHLASQEGFCCMECGVGIIRFLSYSVVLYTDHDASAGKVSDLNSISATRRFASQLGHRL